MNSTLSGVVDTRRGLAALERLALAAKPACGVKRPQGRGGAESRRWASWPCVYLAPVPDVVSLVEWTRASRHFGAPPLAASFWLYCHFE